MTKDEIRQAWLDDTTEQAFEDGKKMLPKIIKRIEEYEKNKDYEKC